MNRSYLCTAFAGMCILAAPVARGENWPQWRGPHSDGISAEMGIATVWSKTNHVVWRTPMPGQGGATPVVWGDRLFVTSASGSDLVLIALNTGDGKEVWRRTVATGNKDARSGEGNSASPSPSTDGKNVWVFFGTGILACYDFSGDEIWKIDVNERYGNIDIQFGMTSTPVLAGDHIYLQLIHGAMKRGDDTRTGKVIKLDKLTGKEVWAVDRVTNADFENKHSYASPFMYQDGNQRFLVSHGADCTTGHSLESGQELWRFDNLNGRSAYNDNDHDPTFRFVASPCVMPGLIVIPTAKKGPTVALRIEDGLRGDVDSNQKAVRWTNPLTPDVSIPLMVDGLVYNVHKEGRVQCLELETGRELYNERTHNFQHRASPVYADGHIYVCARDGVCTVLKAGREFKIVASNDLGEPITASPVVSNGILFLRTYDAVYAIK